MNIGEFKDDLDLKNKGQKCYYGEAWMLIASWNRPEFYECMNSEMEMLKLEHDYDESAKGAKKLQLKISVKAMANAIAETIVLDWGGWNGLDGKPLKYSKEWLKKNLPKEEFQRMFEWIQMQAKNDSNYRFNYQENLAKKPKATSKK